MEILYNFLRNRIPTMRVSDTSKISSALWKPTKKLHFIPSFFTSFSPKIFLIKINLLGATPHKAANLFRYLSGSAFKASILYFIYINYKDEKQWLQYEKANKQGSFKL